MKKTIGYFMCFLALLITPNVIHASEDKEIIATIRPIHSIVQFIAGDTLEVDLLISGETSPHDVQLKPSHMRKLRQAKLVFYLDDTFERFLAKPLQEKDGEAQFVRLLNEDEMTLYALRNAGVWEGAHAGHDHGQHEEEGHHDHHDHHDHGHHDHHGHEGHGHDESHHEDEHDEMFEVVDSHIWLDAENAVRMAEAVARKLSESYPDNSEAYGNNLNEFIERVESLDKRLDERFAGYRDVPFLVFHDAYQYLEKRYQLNAVGAITLEPSESPSPKRLGQLRERIQSDSVRCIFSEPGYSSRLINVLKEHEAIKGEELDPLGVKVEAGPEHYFGTMEAMADALEKCLD